MSMVDGVVLVVDATEGVMSQTKFVLSKAIHHGLLPVVVLNKVSLPLSNLLFLLVGRLPLLLLLLMLLLLLLVVVVEYYYYYC